MAKFKVGDKVVLLDKSEVSLMHGYDPAYCDEHISRVGQVGIVQDLDDAPDVKFPDGRVLIISDKKLRLVEKEDVRECPSIIKLEQKFTLQIKEHVIELNKAEVTALKEQLLEI